MIEAVFISDLHLNPDDETITGRFNKFIDWAATHTKALYILGDFFHVWPGDDSLDDWSQAIAKRLAWLASSGVKIYFMHGNRDFLLGTEFANLASMEILPEPTLITINNQTILLVHGDRFCTRDRGHQWLRRLTRNALFPKLFLSFPLKLRTKFVQQVRKHSQANNSKKDYHLDIVVKDMLDMMHQLNVTQLIHGHTHKPGLVTHGYLGQTYHQYVLSDWDDKPQLLCYDKSSGFYFNLFAES